MSGQVINFPDRKDDQYVVLVVDDAFLMRGVLRKS